MDRRAFLGVVAATALAARGVEPPLRQLKRLVDGDVVGAGDAHYASARQLWDARFDVLRPRAIVYCASATDVARTLDWARMHQIRAVPRSGGHSYAGYSSGNGVVIVDVSRLNQVSVVSGHARVGAGAKLIDVYAALAARSETIPAGSCPTVGIAGLALGGGIGYASRAFGLTSDNLQRVHIVTADGELRACDVRNEPDLFWACRGGGGGNFGIVTSLDIAKHPASTVSTYSIEWPWEQAAQAVAAWQAFAPHAPDELFSVLDLIATGPTAPGARAHVVSAGQYFGTETALTALIQPLASTGAPISVKTASVSYLDTVLHWAGCRDAAACTEPRPTFKAKSDYVSRPLPAEAIAALVNGISARQTAGRGAVYLDPMGGAINRVPKGETAFVHRDHLFSIQYTAQWSGSAAAAPSLAWLAGVHTALRPHVSGYAYQNYIDPSLPGWRDAYYGSNLRRLESVRKRYDPHRRFRFAQSI
jgi:FAD/FMN-containing dehydrogenase